MKKTLSIVIPVYNEEYRLQKTFSALNKGIPSCGLKLTEIIFVNDGSKDNTLSILLAKRSKLEQKMSVKVKIVTYAKNQGKGYAVRMGMLASQSNYALLMDADMSTELTELTKMKSFVLRNADVVVGTRKNQEAEVIKEQPFYRRNMGKVFTMLSRYILGLNVTDFTCGFKLFSNNAIKNIFPNSQINRWAYDSEILFVAQKHNFKINEVAVIWKDDNRTKVRVISAAIKSFTDLIKIRVYDLFNVYNDSKGISTLYSSVGNRYL